MSFAEILAHFDQRTRLPIAIEEIKTKVIELTQVDRLTFIGVDCDPKIYRGQMEAYTAQPAPYADHIVCYDIWYANSLPAPEKRIVLAKELLHVLDATGLKVSTRAGAERLISEIVLDPMLIPPDEAGTPAVVWDRWLLYCAGAVLLPFAAREIMRPAYEAGTLPLEEIARVAALPPNIVQFVMSGTWPKVRQLLQQVGPFDT